jgi:hypothetical protein
LKRPISSHFATIEMPVSATKEPAAKTTLRA